MIIRFFVAWMLSFVSLTYVGVVSAQEAEISHGPPAVSPTPTEPSSAANDHQESSAYRYQPMAFPPEPDERLDHEQAHSSRMMMSLGWDMAVGVGSLNDYISNVSFAGVQLEGRWFLNDHFTLGGSIGWNRFSQVFEQRTYPIENGALTGSTHKFADFVTPKFLAHYHFLPHHKIRPYVGVGLGLSIVSSDIYIADLVVSSSRGAFAMSPEAGVLLPLWVSNGTGGLQLGVRYTFTTANFGSQVFGYVHDAQYLSWQIGFFQAM